MDEDVPPQDRLFEEAMDLIIRLQNDPASPVVRDMIRQWYAQSPEHEAAWDEVVEIHGMAGKILANDKTKSSHLQSHLTRRTLLLAGFIGAGALTAKYVEMPDFLLGIGADIVTGTAEIREVVLADGSIATMGPDSAIAIQFDERKRHIKLLTGMVFFQVKSEADRAFQVSASNLTATAIGTAFEVSAVSNVLSVSVDHGLVKLEDRQLEITGGNELAAGQWISLEDKTAFQQRGTREISQVAAWRKAQIFAENEPIASVIAKIGRWHRARIVIADPSFGNQRVSGVFDVSNPMRALEAVIHPYGGHIHKLGSYLTLITPV